MEIKELMKSSVISVEADAHIGHVLDIMKKENVNGLPVVDKNKHLVGIVVRADIYRFLIDPGHYKTCPVEWVMTKDVIHASVHEDINDVARRLRKNDIIALPIIENEQVVGIVSIEDFMDYFLG